MLRRRRCSYGSWLITNHGSYLGYAYSHAGADFHWCAKLCLDKRTGSGGCERKIQNQDFSFDPRRTPLSYTPLSFAAGGREGSNPKCNVCQNYSPGEHAVWQAVGESVKEGSSACPDELWKLYTRAQRVRARGRSNCIRSTPTII